MTKMRDVLRRADRTAAFALLLVFATASGAATSGNNPTTDHQYTNHPSTAQLRGIAAEAEGRAALTPRCSWRRTPSGAPSAVELAMVKFAAEQRCLAEVMYYEARGEGVEGQEAIAEVVFHRMIAAAIPAPSAAWSIRAGRCAGCQFSFVCNGEMRRPKVGSRLGTRKASRRQNPQRLHNLGQHHRWGDVVSCCRC